MNDQQPTIQFAAGGQSVSITLLALYGSMAGERHARVVARSGAFHGELASVLWTYDLHALQHLLTVLDATVGQPNRQEWRSMEDELALAFELTPVGHVLLHVELRDRSSDWSRPTTLRFTILADQTYLPVWREHIAQALEQMTL
jgi:hypothetical protein